MTVRLVERSIYIYVYMNTYIDKPIAQHAYITYTGDIVYGYCYASFYAYRVDPGTTAGRAASTAISASLNITRGNTPTAPKKHVKAHS